MVLQRFSKGLGAHWRKPGEYVWQCGSGSPHVMILGGVHGNELVGIEVVHRMLDVNVKCGTLTLALGNPAAIAKGTRGSEV